MLMTIQLRLAERILRQKKQERERAEQMLWQACHAERQAQENVTRVLGVMYEQETTR